MLYIATAAACAYIWFKFIAIVELYIIYDEYIFSNRRFVILAKRKSFAPKNLKFYSYRRIYGLDTTFIVLYILHLYSSVENTVEIEWRSTVENTVQKMDGEAVWYLKVGTSKVSVKE
jgi:hypothetical protein